MPAITNTANKLKLASGAILTVKQKEFVEYYLGKDNSEIGNATESARKAGYKGTEEALATIGYQNLRKDQIKEYMRYLLDATVLSEENVDTQLGKVLLQDQELNAKMRAISEYNKIKGRYAPDKSVNLLVNANQLLEQIQNA